MVTCAVFVEFTAVVELAVASMTISSDLFATALSTILSAVDLSTVAEVVPLLVEVLSLRSALVVALSVPEVPELVTLSVAGGKTAPPPPPPPVPGKLPEVTFSR